MNIKGTSIIHYHNYVKNNFSDKFSEWLEKLPDESRKIYENVILSTNWYDLNDSYVIPIKFISEMFFDGNVSKTAFELSYLSAISALNGVYKIFIKIASLDFVIKRALNILTTYFSDVNVEILETNNSFFTMKINGFQKGQEIIFDSICGWVTGLLSFVLKTKYSVTQTNIELSNNYIEAIILVKLNIV